MKKLLLMRHAKSSWDDPDWTDFERPLTTRGRRDALAAGDALRTRNIKPGIVSSSPANRALTTARLLSKGVGYALEDIHVDERMYETGRAELLEVVHSLDDRHGTALLVGHNPGMQSLAMYLSTFRDPHFQTCAVVCLGFDVDSWKAVERSKGEVLFYELPKR